ncbi:MAG: hypothetical protein ACLT98_11285 [Eggerthellaceae bacterium]
MDDGSTKDDTAAKADAWRSGTPFGRAPGERRAWAAVNTDWRTPRGATSRW